MSVKSFKDSAELLGMRKSVSIEELPGKTFGRERKNHEFKPLGDLFLATGFGARSVGADATKAAKKFSELPLVAARLNTKAIVADARMSVTKEALERELSKVRADKQLSLALERLSNGNPLKVLDGARKIDKLLSRLKLTAPQESLLHSLKALLVEGEERAAEKRETLKALEKVKELVEDAGLGVGELHKAIQLLPDDEQVKAKKAVVETKKLVGD